MTSRPRLTVLGTGYLGITHAACMAQLGFEVLGVDTNREKVIQLSGGDPLFSSPSLAGGSVTAWPPDDWPSPPPMRTPRPSVICISSVSAHRSGTTGTVPISARLMRVSQH